MAYGAIRFKSNHQALDNNTVIILTHKGDRDSMDDILRTCRSPINRMMHLFKELDSDFVVNVVVSQSIHNELLVIYLEFNILLLKYYNRDLFI